MALAPVFEDQPDHPEALILAGDINASLGRASDAADFYRLVLQQEPRHPLARQKLDLLTRA